MNEIIIAYGDSFLDQYDCLPKQINEKFKKQKKALRNNPKRPSLRIHRIKGTEFWESTLTNIIGVCSNKQGISIAYTL
jgi:hypothetical protein